MDRDGDDELTALARRWWPSDGSDEAFERSGEILAEHHELVPAWIRALLRVGPVAGDRFLGTSLIEDLYYDTRREGRKPSLPLDLLLEAELDRVSLFGVLSGVYGDMLEWMGAETVLAGRLSQEQIEWLLDDKAPHRWADNGTMVADGESVRFVDGETEWQRLYGQKGDAEGGA